jgi:hypothetical protein
MEGAEAGTQALQVRLTSFLVTLALSDDSRQTMIYVTDIYDDTSQGRAAGEGNGVDAGGRSGLETQDEVFVSD